MSQVNKLEQDFDDLVNLLKKIKSQSKDNKLGSIDLTFLNDFDLLIENYGLIKSTFTEDIAKVVGQPLVEMVQQLIVMLKEELLDVYKQGVGNYSEDEIESIDSLMKSQNLSIKDIDSLLDKRIELMNKNSKS